MRIFFDTCTLVDVICDRKNAQLIDAILKDADNNGWNCYISVGSFYTLTYLIELNLKHSGYSDKESRINRLREILNNILDSFSLSDVFTDDLRIAANDASFSDLEDSYQYRAALNAHCDYLITDNMNDFKNADQTNIKILEPKDFNVV